MGGTQSYFWGIFLTGVGILMIIKHQFKLDISMPRIIIGIFFLALGASMFLSSPRVVTKSNIIFAENTVDVTVPEKEYNIVFGNMVMDISNISKESLGDKIKINTVFGNTLIKIDPKIPTIIKVNAAFGSGSTSDGSTVAFGDRTYKIGDTDSGQVLRIEASVVFGRLEIIEK